MKKIFALGWMLVAALALTNCSKEETVAPEVEGKAFELFANTNGTRTTMENLKTTWESGDAMNVWTANSDSYLPHGQFTISDVENGKFTGTLNTEIDDTTANDWFAIYPYSSYLTLPDGTNYMYVGHTTPKQEGNNSQAHLSGSSAPLYGIATAVAGEETPVFQMHHLSTFVRVRVTNNTEAPFTVASVYLTSESGLYLAGSYYVNITGEDGVVYTPSGGTYTKTEVTLTVNNGEEIAVDDQAEFYLPLAPIQFGEADEMLTVDITTTEGATISVEKTIPAGTKFAAGVMNTLKVEATKDNTEYPVVEWTTIADIHAASAEGTYNIQNATVVAVGKYNSLLYDGTGYLYSYQNLGVAVGDIVNITNALTSTYGERQIKEGATVEVIGTTTVEHPTPEVIADATAFNELTGNYTVGQYVTIYASSISTGSYLNFTVDGGSATGSFITPSDTAELVALNGLPAKITGYVCYLNSSNYFYVFMTDIEALPYLTVDPTSLTWNATETTAMTITVSSNDENWTIDETTVPEWAEVVKTDATTLTITPSANNGTERSATVVLKHATEDITTKIDLSQGAEGVETATAYCVFSEKGFENADELNNVAIAINDDVTATFATGTGSTTPKYYTTGSAARLYGGNTLTISSKEGMAIQKVIITSVTNSSYIINDANTDFDSGSVTYSSNVATWEASDAVSSLVVKNPNSSGHVRITRIDVTYTK